MEQEAAKKEFETKELKEIQKPRKGFLYCALYVHTTLRQVKGALVVRKAGI